MMPRSVSNSSEQLKPQLLRSTLIQDTSEAKKQVHSVQAPSIDDDKSIDDDEVDGDEVDGEVMSQEAKYHKKHSLRAKPLLALYRR